MSSIRSTAIIKTHTVTGASTGQHLLITGGVHGDEFEPMAAVRQLMQIVEPSQLRGRVTFAAGGERSGLCAGAPHG